MIPFIIWAITAVVFLARVWQVSRQRSCRLCGRRASEGADIVACDHCGQDHCGLCRDVARGGSVCLACSRLFMAICQCHPPATRQVL